MIKSRSESDLNSIEMDKPCPELPLEIWRMILSMLPFNDQVNCRVVCCDWLDLITTLPEFINKNRLDPDQCLISENDDPVTTIMNSKLQFRSMRIGSKVTLKVFPSLDTFFARIGETVTYLDITKSTQRHIINSFYFNSYSDAFRIVIENLHLFKVLHHLTLNNLSDWFEVATSSCPNDEVDGILRWILRKDLHTPFYTYDLIKSILDSPNMDLLRQNIFMKRFKYLLLEKISDNLETLNQEKYFNDEVQLETIDIIANQVLKAIEEADKSIDFSTRINKNLKVICFDMIDELTFQKFDQILKFVPNLQELQITYWDEDGDAEKIIEQYSNMISFLHINVLNFSMLEKLNFPKIRQLHASRLETDLDRCIKVFPSVKSLDVYCRQLPQTHFEYITKLKINTLEHIDGPLFLSNLVAFKNLQTLSVHASKYFRNGCFFGHQPTMLESIKVLKFYWTHRLCLKCFKAFLKSLKNLRTFKFTFDSEENAAAVDIIFNTQTKLEALKIHHYARASERDSYLPFKPNIEWPEMKNLKRLILRCKNVSGDKTSWDDFGKKLVKLKYLQVKAESDIDLLDFIRTKTSSAFPLLKRVRIRKYCGEGWKLIITNVFELHGRKIIFDKYLEDSL